MSKWNANYRWWKIANYLRMFVQIWGYLWQNKHFNNRKGIKLKENSLRKWNKNLKPYLELKFHKKKNRSLRLKRFQGNWPSKKLSRSRVWMEVSVHRTWWSHCMLRISAKLTRRRSFIACWEWCWSVTWRRDGLRSTTLRSNIV